MKLDNIIKRRFTDGSDVYAMFAWKRVDVVIKDHKTGAVIYELKDAEFPEGYSQSACDIIASKYFRKKGLGEGGTDGETSLRQPVHRMTRFWIDALKKAGLITEKQAVIVYDELVYMTLAQIFAPNSPQWFNTGLRLAYGITGKAEGSFYYDGETNKTMASEDLYTRSSGSACFILSVDDTLFGERSLTETMATETRLFKYGSGAGSNWSAVRGKDEALSGGGRSSGLVSFLKAFDRNAGAIKSGGVTRRAAKMNILDASHPDIMEFIRWKAEEEDKAMALGRAGYSTEFQGVAYDTVSGQNVNNTVRLTDDFMEALDDPEAMFELTGRVDRAVDKQVPTRELFDAIAQAAWRCGDPGVQFSDTINSWHTCPGGADGIINAPHNRINGSNPCSEYLFLDDSACNLASINVYAFYNTETGTFDTEKYTHAVTMAMLALEATICGGQYPTERIAVNTYKFRTTGLGVSNLASLLMAAGIPYGSEQGCALAAALLSLLTGQAYHVSACMAEKAGPFECYAINNEFMTKVVHNHARAAGVLDTGFAGLSYKPVTIDHGLLINMGFGGLSEALRKAWNAAIHNGGDHGYRNAQVSCVAPTGTISLAMDCAATSIEPFYSHVTYKKMADQSVMEQINPMIPIALTKLGYTDAETLEINEYILHNGVKNPPHLKPEHYAVFATAGGYNAITPEEHIRMMGALAPHISGGVSKTVNLPGDADVGDIAAIFRQAWELGVKAVTVYRDGSKGAQPLNTALTGGTGQVAIPTRVKPRGIRNARVHEACIENNIKLYITTSFYDDGRLGEIYVSAGRQGSLIKGLLDSISTMISEMLQYGVDPKDIARMYRGQKFEPSGFVTGHPYIKAVDSISDLISKIIDIELGNFEHCQVKPEGFATVETGKNVKVDWAASGEFCPVCNSDKLVKSGVCKVCLDCGATTGCS